MRLIKNDVAYIIKRTNEIRDEKPGKKMLQKMVFLIKHKGIDLDYDYGLHFYGPYCVALDSETSSLSADGVILFDYSGCSHLMSVNEEFTIQSEKLSDEQEKRIDDLVIYFKKWTPSDLELLTTAMYVYEHLEDKSKSSVIKGVEKIKGSKYSREKIEETIKSFSYFDMLLQ